MSEVIQQYIKNKLCFDKNNQRHPIYNPALGTIIKEVAFANESEVNAAVTAAFEAYDSWQSTPALKRARILFKFKTLLERDSEKLAVMLTTEHGKVLDDARGEILRAIELVEYMCGIPHLLKGEFSQNVADSVDCYTFRQPLGVCVGITPFNFPVMISCWMLVSAIACGNTFVLKPSEKDPSAVMLLAELLQESGLPAGVLNVVHGNEKVVTQLITHEKVKAVSCVGSSVISAAIYKTAIMHGKRAQTFGGAKNHAVIMPDTDLNEAAITLLGAAYGAAGERCMALSVAVVIGDARADMLVDKLKQHILTLKIGSGMLAGVDMGPLVTREHLDRVHYYVDIGVNEGAKLVVDGRNHRDLQYENGFFMGPSLFDNVKSYMQIYREEIFGPVLIIMRVKNLSEAITLINEHAYGNGTTIFTNDGGAAQRFVSEITVGMVGVNVAIPVPVAFHVFGGWKNSIFGDMHMHGEESVRFYTQSKSVTARWPQQKNLDAVFNMPAN